MDQFPRYDRRVTNLSHEEHKLAVEICIEETAKRVPVIAGTGSSSIDEAIDLGLHAEKAGADGALVVTPYYKSTTWSYSHSKQIVRQLHFQLLFRISKDQSLI